jgi:sugar lactone lactonase YvrE
MPSLARWCAAALLSATPLLSLSAQAQVTFTGTAPVTLGTGGFGTAVDVNGNVYVADLNNQQILEYVAVNGSIPASPTTKVLGSGFVFPSDVKVDAAGDVFVADNTGVYEIVAVNGSIPATPTIRTLVTPAAPNGPWAIALDAAGDIFYTAPPSGSVFEIVAVNGSIPASPTVRTLTTGLNFPQGIAVDIKGDVFVANQNSNSIVEMMAVNGSIPANPTITTLTSAFNAPATVAVDGSGNLFVADQSASGLYEVFAVNGSIPANPTILPLSGGIPNATGGIAVDNSGDVFVTNFGGNTLQETQTGVVKFGSVNVCPAGATTPAPCSQNLTLAFSVQAGTTIGSVSVLTRGAAGKDFHPLAGDTSTTLCAEKTYATATTCTVDVTYAPLAPGFILGAVQLSGANGTVLATASLTGTGAGPEMAFNPPSITALGSGYKSPRGVAVDGAENVFVADDLNNSIKKIVAVNGSIPASPTIVSVGSGFIQPQSVAVDGAGSIFVTDTGDNAIKEIIAVNGAIPANPTIRTLITVATPIGATVDAAGDVFYINYSTGFVEELVAVNGSIPANPAVTDLYYGPLPNGGSLAVDAAGNVFVADTYDSTILELMAVHGVVPGPYPTVRTLYKGAAGFQPSRIALDAAGDVLCTDRYTGGVYELIAVNGSIPASPSLVPVSTAVRYPDGLAVDGKGNVFVSDFNNNLVEEVVRSAPPSLTFPTITVGQPSKALSVIFQNVGNAPLAPVTVSGLTYIIPGLSLGPNLTLQGYNGLNLAGGAFAAETVAYSNTATGGTFQTSATFTDNSLNANPAMQTVPMNITINKLPQTITFPPPVYVNPVGKRPTYWQLSATASSGLGVTYSIKVVNGSWTLKGSQLFLTTLHGIVQVFANQAGNGAYLPAPPVMQTISF